MTQTENIKHYPIKRFSDLVLATKASIRRLRSIAGRHWRLH